MTVYLNSNDNDTTYNKKNYLLLADKRLDWGIFKDFKHATEQPEYLLNIEPCDPGRGSKWTGLWHIDILLNSPYPHHYDVDDLFLASDQGIYPYPEDKTTILFQACDPELHRRIPEVEQRYDFVIAGTIGAGVYQKRSDAYDLLKNNFFYVDYGKNHVPERYIKYLNTAKVQFIRGGESDTGKANAAQRFFECIAIGPVLTNWTDDLPLTGFIEDVDFLAYRNNEEMLAKMKLLLGDEDLRKKIAANGRRKALAYHTYEHRLVSILKAINEHTALGAT